MILLIKIGKWLLGKAIGIVFFLFILFLVFLMVNVFLPKLKIAVDLAFEKEAQRASVEKSIKETEGRISTAEQSIDNETEKLSRERAKEQTILEKINKFKSELEDSAQLEFQRQKEEKEKELKSLEDSWPWFFRVPSRYIHAGKISKKKLEIEGIKLGTALLEDDHPLLQEWKEVVGKIQFSDDQLTRTQAELESLRSSHSGLKYEQEKLLGNVPFVQEIVAEWLFFKTWITWAVASMIIAGVVWPMVMFYLVAPVVSKQQPIQLAKQTGGISWSDPKTTLDLTLPPDDQLWVRSELLTQHDFATKRTDLFWNWRAPAVSAVAGLAPCTRVTNNEDNAARFSLSPNDAEMEISEIVLEKDASIVLHVANIVAVSGDVTVLAKWRIFSLNAWLTWQLRFLIFKGPGSIFIGSPRGINGYRVSKKQMVEQQVAIGFDSGLNYSVKRTEVFMPYLLRKASLFDDCFQGDGIMFRKNAATHGRKSFLEKTSGAFFSILGKLLGF